MNQLEAPNWKQSLKSLGKEVWKDVRENKNLKSPAMWAVWVIPTICVPTFRYLQDSTRPPKDRFKISVRDFAAYVVGTILFFTFSPASSTVFRKLYEKQGKSGKALDNSVAFATSVFGSFASALYSGFGAMPFAQWINRKFLDEKPAAITKGSHPFSVNQSTQLAQWQRAQSSPSSLRAFYGNYRSNGPILFPV